ncbi:MAG: copper resistance protein CopC [Thermoleophilia bacterium]
MRLLLLIVAAVLALGVYSTNAFAHAELVATSPADGSTLKAPPKRVVLTFDEPVNTIGAHIDVFSSDGTNVAVGRAVARGRTLSTLLGPEVPRGTLSVFWSAISDDGHSETGSLSFTFGEASEKIAPAPTTRLPSSGSTITSLVRAIRFGTSLILVGAVVFLIVIWDPQLRRRAAQQRSPLEHEGAVRRTAIRLGLMSAAALAFIAAATLPIEAWTDGISLNDIAHLRQGVVAIGACVAALLTLPALLLMERRRSQLATVVVLVLTATIALAPGLSGHASTLSSAWASILTDWAHVLAAGVWGGSIIVMAVSLPGFLRTLSASDRSDVYSQTAQSFTRLALGSLAVLIATGLLSAYRLTGSLLELTDSSWGRILVAKVIIVIVAIAVAAVIRTSSRRAATGLQLEATLIIAVIALTGTLTGLSPKPPAVTSVARTLHVEQQFGGKTARIDVRPGITSAPNAVVVAVTNNVGQPALDVTNTTITVTSPNAGGTTLAIPLHRVGPASWSGDIVFPAAGSWNVSAKIRNGQTVLDVVTGTITIVS